MKKEIFIYILILVFIIFLLVLNNYNNFTGKVIVENYFEGVSWNHMPLTYYINYTSCGVLMPERIKKAFDIISNESSLIVSFIETNYIEDADIKIQCFESINFLKGFYESANAKYFTSDTDKSKIEYAEIFFYNVNPKSKNRFSGGCSGYPNVEIHEVLHIFGFSHKKGYSIMNPLIDGCRIKNIDKEFIEKLKEIYK